MKMSLDPDRLARSRTIDLTTTGRRSGLPRTVEIWWFRVDGRFVITGTPGQRDWLANVGANPNVIIAVDGMLIEATVTPITDQAFRRRVFTHPETRWYSTQEELERLVATSPMVEVALPV